MLKVTPDTSKTIVDSFLSDFNGIDCNSLRRLLKEFDSRAASEFNPPNSKECWANFITCLMDKNNCDAAPYVKEYTTPDKESIPTNRPKL